MIVRFFPTGYVPPTRIGHDLSPLQRDLMEVIGRYGPISLQRIRADLEGDVPERTVQDNLQLLRRLELVEVTGHGRGARWSLKPMAW